MEALQAAASQGEGLSATLAQSLLARLANTSAEPAAPPSSRWYKLKEVLPKAALGTGLVRPGSDQIVLQYHSRPNKNAFCVDSFGSLVHRLCLLFASGEMDTAPPVCRHAFYYFYRHPCIPGFDFDGKEVSPAQMCSSLRVFKRGLFHYMHSELGMEWERARCVMDHLGVFHSVDSSDEHTLDPSDHVKRAKMSCHVHCVLHGPLATGWAEHLSVARFVHDFVAQQAGHAAVNVDLQVYSSGRAFRMLTQRKFDTAGTKFLSPLPDEHLSGHKLLATLRGMDRLQALMYCVGLTHCGVYAPECVRQPRVRVSSPEEKTSMRTGTKRKAKRDTPRPVKRRTPNPANQLLRDILRAGLQSALNNHPKAEVIRSWLSSLDECTINVKTKLSCIDSVDFAPVFVTVNLKSTACMCLDDRTAHQRTRAFLSFNLRTTRNQHLPTEISCGCWKRHAPPHKIHVQLEGVPACRAQLLAERIPPQPAPQPDPAQFDRLHQLYQHTAVLANQFGPQVKHAIVHAIVPDHRRPNVIGLLTRQGNKLLHTSYVHADVLDQQILLAMSQHPELKVSRANPAVCYFAPLCYSAPAHNLVAFAYLKHPEHFVRLLATLGRQPVSHAPLMHPSCNLALTQLRDTQEVALFHCFLQVATKHCVAPLRFSLDPFPHFQHLQQDTMHKLRADGQHTTCHNTNRLLLQTPLPHCVDSNGANVVFHFVDTYLPDTPAQQIIPQQYPTELAISPLQTPHTTHLPVFDESDTRYTTSDFEQRVADAQLHKALTITIAHAHLFSLAETHTILQHIAPHARVDVHIDSHVLPPHKQLGSGFLLMALRAPKVLRHPHDTPPQHAELEHMQTQLVHPGHFTLVYPEYTVRVSRTRNPAPPNAAAWTNAAHAPNKPKDLATCHAYPTRTAQTHAIHCTHLNPYDPIHILTALRRDVLANPKKKKFDQYDVVLLPTHTHTPTEQPLAAADIGMMVNW